MTFESLEQRLALDAAPLAISEFMADNNNTLDDEDGDSSDWIEIRNLTDQTIDLQGWYLTDDPADLTQWQFPSITLGGDGYQLVFASEKDRTDPAAPLHTNFRLDADGEYLALVYPDGITVAHEYAPAYPEQVEDASYGPGAVTSVWDTLVSSDAPVSYHVPVPGDDVHTWTAPSYDDSDWTDSYTVGGAGLLITEIATGETSFVEIENAGHETIDTTGWSVILNDASAGVMVAHFQTWDLPVSIDPGEVLYQTDDPADRYFGSPINWDAEGPGWAAVLDGTGQVVDFVAWGYSDAEIAFLNIAEQWNGAGAEPGSLDAGGPIGETFVAYNDHITGPETHANTTTYDATNGGTASGPLTNMADGQPTSAVLTTSHTGAVFDNNSAPPAPDTDAYNAFHGFIDFSNPARSSIEISGNDDYTHTFSSLDVGDVVTYNFTGTSIRGNS
ncbi:MAG: lamin tail domain-containing protein, partial [Thermoguttaceae bacterium]